jgi:hypothetical protein
MYNLASIASVTALAQDKNKIETKHIGFVRTYIGKECTGPSGNGSQKGGDSMPSEFYGYSTGAYSAGNAGGINMSDANFGAGGYIRPELGMSGGASGAHVHTHARASTAAKRFIKSILKFNGVSISKTAFDELLLLIDMHIRCLHHDLMKQYPLTLPKLEKILALKRHSVFN